MEQPLVSVIIPVFNTEKYILEALESVSFQDYKNIEIIVVNDGSTDNTLNILRKYSKKIKIISQEKNMGQSISRNVGVKEANGDIVGFLDADDLWPKNHVSLGVKYLNENNDYDFVRGQTKYFRLVDDKRELTDNVFMEMLVGASLYKAKIFGTVGFFDEEMKCGEDLDWFIRISESNLKEKRIPNTMLFYRRHENNMTNSKSLLIKGQTEACMKKIKRNKKLI